MCWTPCRWHSEHTTRGNVRRTVAAWVQSVLAPLAESYHAQSVALTGSFCWSLLAVVAAWHWSLRLLTARGDLTWVLPGPAAMMQGQGHECAAVHTSRQAVVVVWFWGRICPTTHQQAGGCDPCTDMRFAGVVGVLRCVAVVPHLADSYC